MSTTSDLLKNVTQAIKDLRAANETPPGQQGDTFKQEMNEYVDAVKQRFDVIVNGNDDVIADINTDNLTLGNENNITGYGSGVSVQNGQLTAAQQVSDEHIRDVIATMLVGRDNVDLEYDDAGNKLYIDGTGTSDGGGSGGGGTTVIDNFESQSLGNYRLIGGFSFSTTASQGSYSLQGTGNKSLISTPGDGLPYYPSRGDTIKLDVYLTNTSGTQVTFGYATESIDTGLEVQLHFGLGEILWLESVAGTEQTPFGRTGHNFKTGTWKTITIDWNSSGGESVTYDGKTLNTPSTPRGSGGIYFRVHNTTAYFDNLRVV